MKSPRRERFAEVKRLIEMRKAGIITDEITKSQLEFTGTFLYQSEVEKFMNQFPSITVDDFNEFQENFNIIKQSVVKGGSGKGGSRLDSLKAAERLGVPEDKRDLYVSEVAKIKEAIKTVASLISDNYRITFAIPKKPTQKPQPENSTDELNETGDNHNEVLNEALDETEIY